MVVCVALPLVQVYQAISIVFMTHSDSDSFINFFKANCKIQPECHVSKPSIYQCRRDVVLIRGGENPLSWAILNPISEGCHSHWPKQDRLTKGREVQKRINSKSCLHTQPENKRSWKAECPTVKKISLIYPHLAGSFLSPKQILQTYFDPNLKWNVWTMPAFDIHNDSELGWQFGPKHFNYGNNLNFLWLQEYFSPPKATVSNEL